MGLWIKQSKGAKFWFSVMSELKARDTQDILIAVIDGRKGFPEADIQTCIVYFIRYSMQFVS